VRRIAFSLLASAVVAVGALGAPIAQAGVTCHFIPAMCPAPTGPGSGGGGSSVPEPGTLGLLALGAAASIGMLRRKKKP
jgi:PEP-CTERM motif